MTLTKPDTRRDFPHVKRFRDFWEREVTAAWLYRELAQHADGDTAATLERLAATEDRHAEHWADLLEQSGVDDLELDRVPVRERILAWVGRRFGVETVVPILVRLESADAGMYVGVAEAPDGISNEEIEIGEALTALGEDDPSQIAPRESRHRADSGGALRAATFGVNDGLVSNLALVMGIAGGTSDPAIVLLAGIAGLIAGALSMASGEWISVRTQRELYERELEVEREELRYFPEEEKRELEMIYTARGVSDRQATALAETIMKDEDTALDTLAREELGLDPDELGSPWVAAFSSFFAFAFGAAVPVLPFAFGGGGAALFASAALSGGMLCVVGAAVSLITGRSAWFSAMRMALIGGGAALATYGVGSLVGVAVG